MPFYCLKFFRRPKPSKRHSPRNYALSEAFSYRASESSRPRRCLCQSFRRERIFPAESPQNEASRLSRSLLLPARPLAVRLGTASQRARQEDSTPREAPPNYRMIAFRGSPSNAPRMTNAFSSSYLCRVYIRGCPRGRASSPLSRFPKPRQFPTYPTYPLTRRAP